MFTHDKFSMSNNQVFEYVSGEHTAKNIMITAVKSSKVVTDNKKRKLRTEIENLMKDFGISKHRLAELVF